MCINAHIYASDAGFICTDPVGPHCTPAAALQHNNWCEWTLKASLKAD